MKILVTGAAGFIGFFLVKKLLERGNEIVGLDNINDYYNPSLKYGRLTETGIAQNDIEYGRLVHSRSYPRYRFVKMNLEDRTGLAGLFVAERFDCVCNLAAQAGVRYSIENPFAYVESNLEGFVNVLECCRRNEVSHLVYASSSSVYGANDKIPFTEDDRVDDPVSLYAATKKANELMANVYAKLYGFAATGLRFFTVYGPWGRPDMAPILFAKAIAEGRSIKVFNYGNLYRDFTYIDDIIEGVVRVLDRVSIDDGEGTEQLHKIYNIGCSHPIHLMEFIETIERALKRTAEKVMLPMQPGDVYTTYADTSKLERDFGYKPSVSLESGIGKFIEWYKSNKNLL